MDASQQTAEEVAQRLFGSLLGTVEIMSVYLGDRLGWYASLASQGPATAPELAARTDTQPRYAREWLEQQAVIGLLSVQDDGAADARVYAIPPSTTEVMTDVSSLAYLAPVGRMFGAVGPALPRLLEAYRSGGGVSWDELGPDARESQADANRPWYESRLGPALSGISTLHDTLSRPAVRLLDVGSGGGWSSIALARAYPDAAVPGIDIDEQSVDDGDGQRPGGRRRRPGHLPPPGRLDPAGRDASTQHSPSSASTTCHDPVDVLSAVRKALAPGATAGRHGRGCRRGVRAPNGDDLERMMYGFSLFVCLPDGLSSTPSVGTGTVMRPSTLRAYGEAAGFTGLRGTADRGLRVLALLPALVTVGATVSTSRCPA